EIQPAKEPVSINLSGVAALGFDPSLVVYPRPEEAFLELTFENGSRLGVSGARVEEGNILARTRFGAAIRVPLAELTRVHARTPSVVYLTEREPAGERYVPYVGPPRPYRRDATVEGHRMRLSGREYERGIGSQSRTLLAYRLEAGDKRFQAMVGLDDRAGPLGSVVFRVLVDNAERFVSPPLSSHDAPRSIDVDLSGARSLILITEFGERGGVRDLADWVEARIVR
ncbi:MAG: NPCBM/NEW2 domain-containing protein, partial [Planctomycetia bacterium]|nr:NPCBM/NEW2 domain-containing protein [Planctomycetia bacterium]